MPKILLSSIGLLLASVGWAGAQPSPATSPGTASTEAASSATAQTGTLLWADSESKSTGKKWLSWPLFGRKPAAPAAPASSKPTRLPEPAEAEPAAESSEAPPDTPSAVSTSKESAPAAAPPPPTAGTCPAEPESTEEICAPKLDIDRPPYPLGCYWISADYMLRWVKKGSVPAPLLAVGGNGTPGSPGINGVGDGPSLLNYGMFSGIQVTGGVHDKYATNGLEFGAFMLEQRSTSAGAASDITGNPAVSLPFSGVNPPGPDRVLLGYPGAFAGAGNVFSSSRVWGGEANVAHCAFCNSNFRGDLLGGFRYLNLAESLGVVGSSVDLVPGGQGTLNGALLPPNTPVQSNDSFSTQNNFYGGQIGGRMEWHYKAFYILTTSKIAFGLSDEIVNIGGATTAYLPGAAPVTVPGGVYALASNSGRTNHPEFAVVPEVGLTFGIQLTPRCRLYAGYSFLYWSNVARPGDQVNYSINRAQIPLSSQYGPVVGAAQPIPFFRSSDFWMQGVDLGFAFHF